MTETRVLTLMGLGLSYEEAAREAVYDRDEAHGLRAALWQRGLIVWSRVGHRLTEAGWAAVGTVSERLPRGQNPRPVVGVPA